MPTWNLQRGCARQIDFVLSNIRILLTYIHIRPPTMDTSMSLHSTIETCQSLQSKEPSHLRTHEMSPLTTLHANRILLYRCIPWILTTIKSMMSTSKTNCADATLRQAPTLAAITYHMPRQTAIEAYTLVGTRPYIMTNRGAQSTFDQLDNVWWWPRLDRLCP